MSKFIDITGKKYNRLTVIKRLENSKDGSPRWLCKCDCGNYTKVLGKNLKNNSVKSCGCLIIENNKEHSKHNLCDTRLYSIWQNILNRCRNKKLKSYKNYGARGIKVCKEWEKDFINFYNWAMANGYKDNLTIERINVNGNYEPNNCKWISIKKQSYNKRNSLRFTINNETKCLAELCKEHNLNYVTIYNRIFKSKMDILTALSKPIMTEKRNKLYKGGNNV